MPITRGLSKPVIKASPPCPRNMNQQTIEALSFPLVLIEAVIEKCAQKPSALGHPKTKCLRKPPGAAREQASHVGGSAMFQKRNEVSNPGRPKPDQEGILRRVHQFIDTAWLKT